MDKLTKYKQKNKEYRSYTNDLIKNIEVILMFDKEYRSYTNV